MFDTLSYSDSLVDIGVPEDQAKLQAKVLSKALESNDFATTKDIIRLETKLEAKMTVMEAKLTANMSEMKLEFTRWIIGMFFAIAGVMFALLRFMLPSIPPS